jgi:hypothetical protein
VVNRYVGIVLERQEQQPAHLDSNRDLNTGSFRHGDGASQIVGAEILDANDQPVRSFSPGDAITIRVRAQARKDLENPVIGVLLRNRLGIDVFGTNTRIEGVETGSLRSGEAFEAEFTFDCSLTRQDYTLTVATQYPEGFSQDWLDDVISFSVVDARDVAGLANFKTKVNWRRIPA